MESYSTANSSLGPSRPTPEGPTLASAIHRLQDLQQTLEQINSQANYLHQKIRGFGFAESNHAKLSNGETSPSPDLPDIVETMSNTITAILSSLSSL